MATLFRCCRCLRNFDREETDALAPRCQACNGPLRTVHVAPDPDARFRLGKDLLLFAWVVLLPAVSTGNGLFARARVSAAEVIQAELRAHSPSWRGASQVRSFRPNEVCFEASWEGEDGAYLFQANYAPAEDVTRVFVFDTRGKMPHRPWLCCTFKGATRVRPVIYHGADRHERRLLEDRAAELNRVVRAACR
jgi:hypothetical protein